MPILSAFFGILVRMYFEDHAPPHFDVEYAGSKAVVDLETGRMLGGKIPRRAATMVEEWRSAHVEALRRAWEAA